MPVDIRNHIQAEIFDYQTLSDALKGLAYPRNRINDLLRQGIIIRVKKGLYVFGDRYRRHPYSKELLANLVYGPSYVSLDYALAYHGLIPERVEALTSVTPNRSRRFSTPVGLFIYRQIPAQAYEVGMVRVEGEHGQAFLIASPEKALVDKIVSVPSIFVIPIQIYRAPVLFVHGLYGNGNTFADMALTLRVNGYYPSSMMQNVINYLPDKKVRKIFFFIKISVTIW